MKERIIKLETNIDDSTGEMLGYLMELLFDAGACDVYYMPIYMKKNRPAWQLNVLCCESDISKLEEIIFLNTTTIGIRCCEYERTTCQRDIENVHTAYGIVQVKVCSFKNQKKVYPEYESVVAICKKTGKTYQDVYQEAVLAYQNNVDAQMHQ